MILAYVFIIIVIVQRFVEMAIANRNAKWIKKQGGYEVAGEHYKGIIAVHGFFFISLLIEITITKQSWTGASALPFALFLLAQLGRVWALSSLGRYWNTRIMIIPGANVVAKGPYKYVRHPNYVIVVLEIAVLPLIFQAYWTAILFTVLNAAVLSVRIKKEEAALKQATNYNDVFQKRRRFIPTYED
ncbi:isoprenylcysteine carboxyl methyltransferase family protein [Alkalihalobacillus oceani]|uniref:isoprenylcysteine carboxyl methyltransferase family protein n=1 Tax=Halalkalibacter oceani TaxID=1653776 RepID=UPI00203FF0EB|nr:isoprenylcysteine carboxyl methyltransferase family protein [Halalkalibacter oceani]MCM3762063.1 isoprenylcysteine carboxyl methyltransferase family protein [Halalkalibacter oceani]